MCFGSAACEWRLSPAGYCGRGAAGGGVVAPGGPRAPSLRHVLGGGQDKAACLVRFGVYRPI